MEKSVKEQIKRNFKTMSFEDACKANESLLPEYINAFGIRSYNSLKAYYSKHQNKVENVAAEPIITDEFEEDLVKVEPGTEVDVIYEPTEDPSNEETANEETISDEKKDEVLLFHWNDKEEFDKGEIEALLQSDSRLLNKKCAIVMQFEIVGDFDIRRSVSMYVGNNGKGWDEWSETREFLENNSLTNERTVRSFSDSNANFPVGTKVVKSWGEKIGYALKKFYLDRYELDNESKVSYPIFVD